MDISEDDDNSLSNKQGNKLVDNSLNEILQAKTASNSDHSVTKREIDEEDSNSEDSIDDNTNENDIKNRQDTFTLEEDISDEKPQFSDDMKSEFTDFSKIDEANPQKLFTNDPWSPNFESEISDANKTEKIADDGNWANFENVQN